jgi:hypothetical protein
LPEIVNFAHDDWAEFAADGGFLFAAFIFTLFATALPRMWRNPWSLGLAFVLIHAGFDYPFPRVAVAGWMFALLGAVNASRSQAAKPHRIEEPRALRTRFAPVPLALAGCCVVGVYWAALLGVADAYFQKATDASVRRAVGIVPDEARYYLRLAQLSDSNPEPLLERALKLNPFDAETLIDLGVDAELRGDFPRAEASLVEAARLDSTWLPRWTLLNYYFRRGNEKEFWIWTARATSSASDRRDFTPLFRLASRLASDPGSGPSAIIRVLPDHPAPLRQFVTYLLETGATQSLEETATRLLVCGVPGNDRPFVFWAIEGFLNHHQPDPAVHLWTKLRERGWIRNDAGIGFADPPLDSSLDWRYKDVAGVTRSLGSDGRLRLEFSGQQPEETGLLERYAPVRPGVKQRAEWKYRIDHAAGVEPEVEPGVEWEIESLAGATLAGSRLESGDQEREGSVEFIPRESIVRIRLLYRRAPGTARISGAVDLMPARVVEHAGSAALLLLDHR